MEGDTLSAPAAFWALAAISLNTMSRPSGNVCGLPSRFAFYIRAGPMTCIIDMLTTVGTVLYHILDGHSTLEAVLIWEAQRFAEPPDAPVVAGSLDKLRCNTAFRIILFGFGAFPQAVKLYSCSGILWIQLVASAYLALFVLDEVMASLSAYARRTHQYSLDHLQVQSTSGKFRWLACAPDLVCLSFLAWDYILSMHAAVSDCAFWVMVWTSESGLFAAAYGDDSVLAAGISVVIAPPIAWGLIQGAMAVCGVWLKIITSWNKWFLFPLVLSAGIVYLMIAWALFVIAIALVFLPFGILDGERARSVCQKLCISGLVCARAYLVMVLLVNIMLLRYRYDERSSFKPAWLDILG